jgi:cyclopropane fatty-acyl-phospholipid synthase-like methyltransferase
MISFQTFLLISIITLSLLIYLNDDNPSLYSALGWRVFQANSYHGPNPAKLKTLPTLDLQARNLKYNDSSNVFFEGWYYKLMEPLHNSQIASEPIAVIPGIFINHNNPLYSEAFIMFVKGMHSNYYRFPISAFTPHTAANDSPDNTENYHINRTDLNSFSFSIGNNIFTERSIRLNLSPNPESDADFSVSGTVELSNSVYWPISIFSPGTMGPYSWIPTMQCNHQVVSIDSTIESGGLSVQIASNSAKTAINLAGGRAYIEKDWGQNFPSTWIWAQSNHFRSRIPVNSPTSLFLSIGAVPWYFGVKFPGFLGAFYHNSTLLRFATYLSSTVHALKITETTVNMVIYDKSFQNALELTFSRPKSPENKGNQASGHSTAGLYGPDRGQMRKYVREALVGARATAKLNKIKYVGEVEAVSGASSEEKLFNSHGYQWESVYEGEADPLVLEVMGDTQWIVDKLQDSYATYYPWALSYQFFQLLSPFSLLLSLITLYFCDFFYFSGYNKRHYENSSSVGSAYDLWTTEGVLEFYWGQHIHHSYYPQGKIDQINFKESKITLINNVLNWAGIEGNDGKIKRILDVGCGIGGSSRYLAKLFPGAEITGITLSAAQKQRAEQLNQAEKLGDRIKIVIADALDTKFPQNSFDLIYSMESGEHMPDKGKFLAELCRICRENGRIVIATWCHRDIQPGRANQARKHYTGQIISEKSAQRSAELSPEERKLLEIVYREWSLPFFISVEQYKELAESSGQLKDVRIDDWSHFVAPTWPHSVLEGAKKLGFLLSCGPKVVWRTLRDVFAIYYMNKGYYQGTIVYGLITAVKK